MKKYLCLFMSMLLLTSVTSCDSSKEDKIDLQEVYDNTEETELLLGLWVTPVTHLTSTPEDAEARYAEIKEAGIVMAYTHHHETHDMEQLMRALDAAERNGIKMMVSLLPDNYRKSMNIVEATKDHPAVYGYNMADEPGGAAFDSLAKLRDDIKAIVSEDKIIMCNMFPNYAPDWALGTKASDGNTVYYNYLDQYMEKVRPDILSFDHYPFMADSNADFNRILIMLDNLSDVRNVGMKYNVDTWGFVQNSSWAGTRIPNDDELRFVCHLHLIFGLKSYSYFLYCQPSDQSGVEGVFEGMLTYHGEKTDIYYRVQKQNQDLKKMKGVFLNYDHVGFVTHNMDERHVNAIRENLRFGTYKELEKIDSEGMILTGLFEKDGKTGLYVMNFDYKQDNTLTLKLNTKSDFKVWGAGGLEQMKKSNSIKLSLKPGEGKFIELG
jgi:hypothetical protein